MKKLYSTILVALFGAAFAFGQMPPVRNVHSTSQLTSHSGRLTSKDHSFQSGARLGNPLPNHIQYIFTDNFDDPCDTTSLQARGYLTYYRGGGAQAGPTWFTGNNTVFPAYNGAPTSYVGANYAVVSGTNDIDSWLVLPGMTLSTTDMFAFYGRSPGAGGGTFYPDSIKVMYSATGDSTPEGTGWVMLDNFQVDTTDWTLHSYSIPTATVNGRLAIRYSVVNGGPNGANSDYIGIDQLSVGQALLDDVAMLPPVPSQYSIIPQSEVQPIDVAGQVNNLGSTNETGVGFNAKVYEFQNLTYVATIFDNPSNAVTLNSGSITAPLSAGPVTLTDTGEYLFEYAAFMANTDLDPTNDTMFTQVNVDDTTYARDDEWLIGSASPLGTTVSSIIGQVYDFPNTAIIKSVSMIYANANLGDQIQADVYGFSGGAVGAVLATSGPYTETAADTSTAFLATLTLPLTTPYSVPAGQQVFVTISQLGTNNIGLGHSDNISTPNTVFYSTDGGATWNAYPGAFDIRPNLDLDNKVNQVAASKGISVFPNPSTGQINIHSSLKNSATVNVYNSVGQVVYTGSYSQLTNTVIDLTGQSAGVYTVQIKTDKEVINNSVVISNR